MSSVSGEPPEPPQIPPEYQDLAEVFSEKQAAKLPPHRGHLDHSIPLEPGAKPQFGPIYNLSEIELETLKDYIESNLEKGFIRPSSSPYGAPSSSSRSPTVVDSGSASIIVLSTNKLSKTDIPSRSFLSSLIACGVQSTSRR